MVCRERPDGSIPELDKQEESSSIKITSNLYVDPQWYLEHMKQQWVFLNYSYILPLPVGYNTGTQLSGSYAAYIYTYR